MTFGTLSLADLYEQHQGLDASVKELRSTMAAIDAEISRREASGVKPGPVSLTQSLVPSIAVELKEPRG